MPMLGMNQDTGKVVKWLRAEGETVDKGEPLFEVETDKVTVEIEAPATGTLSGISAAEGEEVPVGRAIAVVLAEGESHSVAVAPPAAPVPSARPRRALASPKARRLAREHGIEIDRLDRLGAERGRDRRRHRAAGSSAPRRPRSRWGRGGG